MLGAGVYWSRRRQRPTEARRALVAAAVYILVMFVSARASRQIVLDEWMAAHGAAALGTDGRAAAGHAAVPRGDCRCAAITTRRAASRGGLQARFRRPIDGPSGPIRRSEAARKVPAIRTMLGWSRFPYFEVAQVRAADRVTFTDLRFGRFVGETTVIVPR